MKMENQIWLPREQDNPKQWLYNPSYGITLDTEVFEK